MSHPTMGAWIEIVIATVLEFESSSHPTMGAWIEIMDYDGYLFVKYVAPHDGCVD